MVANHKAAMLHVDAQFEKWKSVQGQLFASRRAPSLVFSISSLEFELL